MKTWQQFKRRDGRISTDSMQIDQKLYEEIQRDAIESLSPKLQVIASTFPIPENAGEVKAALERHIAASTPSLDEVVAKASQSFVWDSTKLGDTIKQAILEYNASLVAEVERLKKDSEHSRQQWQMWERNVNACEKEIRELRTQLSTAEQTGYERAKRDAAALCDMTDGYGAASPSEIQKAILSLLNKKGTE